MTADPRAADLTAGSVVANTNTAAVARRNTLGPDDQRWEDTRGAILSDKTVDFLLDRGEMTVLRIGDGTEEG